MTAPIFSSLYRLPDAVSLSSGQEREERASAFDLFLPSSDGSLVICFVYLVGTAGPRQHQYQVRLFSTHTGQLCKSYLLTLPSKIVLSCPCMDETDGSILIIGLPIGPYPCYIILNTCPTANLLYKIVFDENNLTAHAQTVFSFPPTFPSPLVIWAAVKNDNFRAISPHDQYAYFDQFLFPVLHELRLSDSHYSQSQIGSPDQQLLLTRKNSISSYFGQGQGYEWNGQVYFNINAQVGHFSYRLVVFDLEHKTIRFLLTNPDPISASKPDYRTKPSFFCHQETLYVMGGSRANRDVRGDRYWDHEMNDCWSVDLITETWHKVAENGAVFAGSQHTMVAPNGSVLIVKPLRNGFSLAKGWVTAPALIDLAWAALLNRFPKMLGLSVEEQVKLGIPRQLQWSTSDADPDSVASEQVTVDPSRDTD